MESESLDVIWRTRAAWGCFLLAFGFLFLFFTQIHPLVVFDCDDWRYISFARDPFPKMNEWNPVRIFPECFMSLMGYFAAYVLTPLVGDYLRSMTYAAALMLSLLITGYLWMFYQLVRSDDHGCLRAVCGTAIFFALHFLLLKVQPYDNRHLFWAFNLTCVFYYLMPTLLNASLVLWIMRGGRLTERYEGLTTAQKGLLWIVLYFAVFSDIMHNIVLLAFLSVYSFWDLCAGGGWKDFRGWMRRHRIEIAVLLLWLACLFFEAHGGRAHEISRFDMPWRETVDAARAIWPMMKHSVVAACLAFIFAAAVMILRRSQAELARETRFRMLLSAACILLVFLYLFLLCTRANPQYIARVDVLFCCFFYFLLLTCLALNALVRRFPVLMQGLPLLAVLVLMLSLNNPRQAFQESTVGNIPAQTCYEMGDELIEQMTAADRAGEKAVTVYIGVGEPKVNWPFAEIMEQDLPQTLFRHGVLQHPLKIRLQPDPEVNRRHHLAVPIWIVSKDPDAENP